MLERIRRLFMEKIKDRRLAIGTKPGPLCPRIRKLLDKKIYFAVGMSYAWNGLDGYENSQTCKYCGVESHNVRTCPKKKEEREASGVGHPKKCTTTNNKRNMPTIEDILDKEQAEHEAYPNPNVATTQLPSQPNSTRKKKMLGQISAHTKVNCSQPNPITAKLIGMTRAKGNSMSQMLDLSKPFFV
ncbi:hypothetical protein LIER_21933 [Lithospermum erythrorhizon]|uniref:LEM domain-containing protein n=1 Tax=Lithospermum erythrorhizon TaxID=34254 RepID=A0AAV3QXQ4_LITER